MSQEFLTAQQILELAIGYEDGIVNFRMLYTLLHILVNNIDGMDTSRIELCTKLNNNERKRDFSRNMLPKHSVVLTEYLVGKDGKKLNQIPKKPNNVVQKIINVSSLTTTSIAAFNDPVNKSRSNTSMATILIDDAKNDIPVENVVSEIDVNLDKNVDKSSKKCEKRFNELENAIKNLTTIVNDLSKNLHICTTLADNAEIGRLRIKLDEVEKRFNKEHCDNTNSNVTGDQMVSGGEVKTNNGAAVNTDSGPSSFSAQNLPPVSDCSKLDILVKDVTKLKNDLKELKSDASTNGESMETKPLTTVDETRLKTIEAKLSTLETIFESFDLDNKKPKRVLTPCTKTQNLDEVQANINAIKDELEKLGDLSGLLLSEKDSVTHQLEKISVQIQTIKEEKADKDDVREALMDKADFNTIQNKVSLDQFNATKCDMSKHIVELIQSLSEKEHAWKQTIKDIQRILGSKIDHHDIIPLKMYIKTQIDHLQGQLKGLENMKQETEAAGTRSKYLRNVNCVSCDATAMMRRVEPCQRITKHESFHPIISLKPYLSYKLDAVRNDHRNSFRIYEQKPMGGAIYDPNYLCNRYCGGSHTKFSIYDKVNKCAFLRPCCNNKRF